MEKIRLQSLLGTHNISSLLLSLVETIGLTKAIDFSQLYWVHIFLSFLLIFLIYFDGWLKISLYWEDQRL